MRKWIGFATMVAVAAAGLALVVQQGADAQVKRGKTRAAETKYLMQGISAAYCPPLGKLLNDGPEGDEGWQTVKRNASLLNELSYILMDDGRCPDATWKGACDTLRQYSGDVLTAAEDQDVDAAKAAFKQLTTACASCHKAHKGK